MQSGQCLCGALQFQVTSEPKDIINCHCNFCQRATGSAYLVETIFDKANFDQISGKPEVYRHQSAGSGKIIHIHFCRRCGTKTHMLFERFPDIVGVFSGTFEETDWFQRTKENSLYFFLSTAPKGTVLPADFEVFDGHYWLSEGGADAPQVFDEPTIVTEEIRRESRARLRQHDEQT